MSIDRYMDDYFTDRDARRVVEVVADHACQDFTPVPGVSIFPSSDPGDSNHPAAPESRSLERARALVDELLRP